MNEPRLNVVLFSGGSGTGTIVEALLRHPQLSPVIVINAYDDGLSTGRLRRFIPGMLGPSDVRKNINRLMPSTEQKHRALRFLADYRLPAGYAPEQSVQTPVLARHYEQLSVTQARLFDEYLNRFRDYAEGKTFDYEDCALGNLLFSGCYLACSSNFNRAVEAFSAFFEIEGRVLNITQGENLFLVARTADGRLIESEAELVSTEATSRIRELFLIDENVYRTQPPERWIEEGSRTPEINPEAKAAIESADMIIYGPGTQHSSLLPSYLTRGVAEAVRANRGVDKVFISNIRRDVDIREEDASELAGKFLEAMSRYGSVSLERDDVATHFFFQQSRESVEEQHHYVPFDAGALSIPSSSVTVRDWETDDGRHAGGYVMHELRRLIQNRIGAALRASPYMVSIVVPALDEENTIEEALRRLMELDFISFDLGKEIIFVDGGSSDRTFERGGKVPGVRAFQLPEPRGRGAALRHGIQNARGDIVVFYPADLEYQEDDLYNVVFSIVRNRFRIVFGTRTVKCTDLETRLKTIYGGKRIPYLVSKYGGMLLSTATLFLYNRYVTDTLTSIKGFEGRTLRSFDLRSDGMDLDTEIVAKACRAGLYILEVPVEYRARTKAQGKKSTAAQGLKALWALFAWRYAGRH